jgi:hypothetical protein
LLAQAEAVPESLKNMLLVMSTAGILSPTPVASQRPHVQNLWGLTYTRLEEFLPGLFHQVLPGDSDGDGGGGGGGGGGGPAGIGMAMASPAGGATPTAAHVPTRPPPSLAMAGPLTPGQ